MNFLSGALRGIRNDRRFFDKVLSTDEASFTNHGQVNISNTRH